MSRLPAVDPATATGRAAELLPAVQAAFGTIPNFAKVMANSPAVLGGYLQLSATFGAGVLPFALRELLAIAVAEANTCTYCLSAHVYVARHVAGVPDGEIAAARRGDGDDPRTRAVLRLALAVNAGRGHVADADFAEARAAGLGDEEIAEIIGNVALNVLTNYYNSATDVEVDFPVVVPGQPLT